MTVLLDIIHDLGQHVDFIYTMEGSSPVIVAEKANIPPVGIEYLGKLCTTTDLFIEVRKGTLYIRERAKETT